MLSVCFALLGVAALLSLPAAAVAEEFAESLPTSPGGMVEVEVDLGDGLRPDPGFLTVAPHPGDDVRLEVHSSGWGSWAVEPRLAKVRDRARAEVRVEGATAWMFGGPRVRIHVLVPEKSRLDIRVRGGEVRVEDVVGDVRARIRDADVELRGIEGGVKIRVVNGAVLAEEIRGPLDVSSTDGAVEAAWVSGPVEIRASEEIEAQHLSDSVVAKTLAGSIALTDVTGPVEARSERGSVEVAFAEATGGSVETERGTVSVVLPPERGATLDAQALRGSVELASSLAFDGEHDGKRAVGEVGGGGPRLRLRTARGEIRVSGR